MLADKLRDRIFHLTEDVDEILEAEYSALTLDALDDAYKVIEGARDQLENALIRVTGIQTSGMSPDSIKTLQGATMRLRAAREEVMAALRTITPDAEYHAFRDSDIS